MEDLTLTADFHLFLPTPLDLAVAYGPVDKPAKMPELEFPSRAVFPPFSLAILNGPAPPVFPFFWDMMGQQKQGLPFHVRWNSSPALLKALYGLQGNSQQLSHLALGFSQMMTDFREFGFLQDDPPYSRRRFRAPIKNSLAAHRF